MACLPGTLIFPKTFSGLLVFLGIFGVVGIVIRSVHVGPEPSLTFEVIRWIFWIGLIVIGWRRLRQVRGR